MAKNYDNIEITTTSSDTYSTFEKSYSFGSVYRRTLGLNCLRDVERSIIKTQEIISETSQVLDVNALTVNGNEISYARIKNLHATQEIYVIMYNSELGAILWQQLNGLEVMQYHSHLKFSDDINETKIDYLSVRGSSSTEPLGGVDIFIGFSA
tara:strand:+ start:2061 stop:2519 length:459 start_codon:yes stop_codon:yes gene_type:complete